MHLLEISILFLVKAICHQCSSLLKGHKLLQGGKVADFFAVIEDDYGIEETFSLPNINMGIQDNTVNITPPEVALTSDITAKLSHINPLDNTTSMGVNFSFVCYSYLVIQFSINPLSSGKSVFQ